MHIEVVLLVCARQGAPSIEAGGTGLCEFHRRQLPTDLTEEPGGQLEVLCFGLAAGLLLSLCNRRTNTGRHNCEIGRGQLLGVERQVNLHQLMPQLLEQLHGVENGRHVVLMAKKPWHRTIFTG